MNELQFSPKRGPKQWADLCQLIKRSDITAESEEVMNSKFKQTANKLISGLVAVATAITMLPHIPAFAETGTTTYSYDGYDVEYSVLNEWENGQSVEVKVTNTGDDSILNWAFKYDAEGEINNLWNATVYDQQGEDYIIKNSGWNYEIAPGQSVNFGYTLVNNEFKTPDDFELCSKKVEKTSGYEIDLNVVDQWYAGVKAELVITNTSDQPFEAWTVSFDSNFTINNLWDGRLLESADNHYTVASEMWTNPIAPGESKTIGFSGAISSEIEAEISNLSLYCITIDGSFQSNEPIIPQEMEAIVAFGSFDEQENSIILEWFYKDNIGDFRIYETSETKQLLAEVSDDSLYYFEIDNKTDEYVFVVECGSLVSNEVVMRANDSGLFEFVIDVDDSYVETIDDNEISDLQILNIDEYYPLEIQFNDDETQVTSISGRFSNITVKSTSDALCSIYSVKTLLGLDNPADQLKFSFFNHSKSGLTYSFIQHHNGIEVLGSSVTVSVDVSGKPVSLSSTVVFDNIISIDNSTALDLSIDDIKNMLRTEFPKMDVYYVAPVIYRKEYTDAPKLKYISVVSDNMYDCKTIVIDANSAIIDEIYTNVNNITIDGSGQNENGDVVEFPVNEQVVYHYNSLITSDKYPVAKMYTMEDTDRKISIYNCEDKNHKYTYRIDLLTQPNVDSQDMWLDPRAISTYTNVIKAYDWWESHFEYKGLNGKGGDISVYVNHASNNASHWGKTLTFGGDKNSRSLGDRLEIVGHEYTHAVFLHKASNSLFLSQKLKTIDEAYCDIFGSFINSNYWMLYPRHLGAPDKGAQKGPKFLDVSDENYDPDYKDEHTNSTIISHAAYLMSHNYLIPFDLLHSLWYDSMAEGYNIFSDFYTVRRNVIKSARKNNFTLSEISDIKKAFDDVGVFADKGNVKLTVFNGKEKISSAKVTLSNYDTSKIEYITSNNHGEVTIMDLETGTHVIKVEVSGHAPIFTSVLVKKGATVNKTLKMNLNEIDKGIFDHYDYPERYSVVLHNHIDISDGYIRMTGYSCDPLKDFILIKDDFSNGFNEVYLSFSINRDSNDWHTMEGGGFLFNASISEKNTLMGYCALLTQQGLKLYYINDVDVDQFRDGQKGNLYAVGTLLGTYYIGDVFANHEIRLRIVDQNITLLDNDMVIINNYILPYNTESHDFGPITSHISHACSQISYFTFSDIEMNVISET